MIVLIDNYDSFTYNLFQYLSELGEEVEVHHNDKITVAQIAARNPAAIVVSPGRCTPKEAGVSVDVIRERGPGIRLLGLCLGHQGIGEGFGETVKRALLPGR